MDQRARIGCLAAAMALVALCGCGAGTAAPRGRVLRVHERDFRIAAPLRVPAGTVTIVDHNAGPDTHELFVVHGAPASIPLRRDGLTVDEDAIAPRVAGSIDGIAAGHDGEVRLRLAPGHYTLFCNMAGHYLGGMRTRLVVT